MSDSGEEPRVIIDYTVIDEATGFKQAELVIWRAFEKAVLQVPEDDRPDPESWVDEFAEEHHYDRKRVRAVTVLGIFAGPRDEFNQRSGAGKAVYANGDTYEGEFLHGKKHGQGHYTFVKQGRGEVDRLLDGLVKARPANEPLDQFVARAAKGLQVGADIVEAALEYGLLPCYRGDYQRGQREGQGVMRNRDSSVYKGDWSANKRHGQGMFFYINGDVYSGEWRDDLKHGFGTYRFAGGGEFRGEWSKGVFCEGQWIMRDGIYFEGTFDGKNRPCDPDGAMHFPHLHMRQGGAYKWDRWSASATLACDEEVPVSPDAWAV